MMTQRGACPTICRYLDDFLLVSASRDLATKSLAIMIDTATKAGFKVQASKTQGPARQLEFLGLIIDTVRQELRISPDRLQEIKELLQEWIEKSSCTKRQILSIIGKLAFCSKMVRSGRKFLRRLIELSKKVKNLHHTIKLTSPAKADLMWWNKSLASHNGITWLHDYWDESIAIITYTDASDIAAGVLYERSWTMRVFDGPYKWIKDMPIAWRELYAIVLGLAVFGQKMQYKTLKMFTDNQAVLHCVNKGSSKDTALMGLIRAMYHYTAVYHINYKAFYISTHHNVASDSLSRLDMPRFRQACPEADQSMTAPVDVLIDFEC